MYIFLAHHLHSISSMLFAAWLAFSMVNCYAGYQCKLPSINSDFNVAHMGPCLNQVLHTFTELPPCDTNALRYCSLLLATSNRCSEGSDTKATVTVVENCTHWIRQCGANGRSLNISLRCFHKCDCTNLCPYFWKLEGFFSTKIKKSYKWASFNGSQTRTCYRTLQHTCDWFTPAGKSRFSITFAAAS